MSQCSLLNIFESSETQHRTSIAWKCNNNDFISDEIYIVEFTLEKANCDEIGKDK